MEDIFVTGFHEDDDDGPQSNNPVNSYPASEINYIRGVRPIPQVLLVTVDTVPDPSRDAKILEALLSTILPPDTFAITALLMNQTLIAKMKVQDNVRKEEEDLMARLVKSKLDEQLKETSSETSESADKPIRRKRRKKSDEDEEPTS